jgi:hypothetical protein
VLDDMVNATQLLPKHFESFRSRVVGLKGFDIHQNMGRGQRMDVQIDHRLHVQWLSMRSLPFELTAFSPPNGTKTVIVTLQQARVAAKT